MIKIQNLSKRFGQRTVLDHLNLDLREGVYGLLGSNGAGKTTLIRCLTGIYPEAKKHISFQGSRSPMIGYLPQAFGLFDNLTAKEALSLIAHMKELPKQQIAEEVIKALSQVNLSDRADDRISSLSGGMIRRLGIAQTLLGAPLLRIYDEPTAGLDPEERLRFHKVVRDNAGRGLTLISTHIVEDIEASSQNVIIMGQGKVLASGSIREIVASADDLIYDVYGAVSEGEHTVIKSYERDGQTVTRVISPKLRPAGAAAVKPTLEDAFIGITKGLIHAQQ